MPAADAEKAARLMAESDIAGADGHGSDLARHFIGLVAGDTTSYLSDPNWKPTLPAKTPGTFLMSDLLRFTGDISPIDQVTTGN